MKRFLSTLIILAAASTALAKSPAKKHEKQSEIGKIVEVLGFWAYAVSEYDVRGKTVNAMLRDLGVRINKAGEFKLENDPESIPAIDEATNVYGVADRRLVEGMLDEAIENENDHADEDGKPLKKPKKSVTQLFDELEKAGAVFGYTSDGGSACGITWPSPLIIDTENNKIYELVMVGGSC